MKFESIHINGKGRGKPMGFPTINLKIPENFELMNGVYAVKVKIENSVFIGALHYGPIPTFNEDVKSLEVYLLETTDDNVGNLEGKLITVEVIKFLRPIIKFKLVESLVKQIEKDVVNIKENTSK